MIENILPTTRRFELRFMERFRETLTRDEQHLLMAANYHGFSPNRYHNWLKEVYPSSAAIRARMNKEFADLHDKFISFCEKEIPGFYERANQV